MSIINDALKKTQDKLSGKKAPRTTAPRSDSKLVRQKVITQEDIKEEPPIYVQRDSRGPNMATILLAIFNISAVTVVLYFGYVLYSSRTNTPKVLPTSKQTTATIASEQTAETSLSVTTSPPPPTKKKIVKYGITLSGTMNVDEKWVAIINEQIYETGEVIDGKKLTEITIDGITFEQDGKSIILKNKEFR